MNLEKMSDNYYKYSSELIAKKLIIMAKNKVIGYVPKISSEMLLYKGKTDSQSVLEWIIEFSDDRMASAIIECCSYSERSKPDFVIALRNMGIENTPIKIDSDDVQFSNEFIKIYNDNYAKECFSQYDNLLEELRDLFYNDGKSDKSAIDLLIISYRYLISNNNVYAVLELRQLIEIKKHFPEKFTYTKILDGAYFDSNDREMLYGKNTWFSNVFN